MLRFAQPTLVWLLLLFAVVPAFSQQGDAWLFAGFKGNSEDGVYFATSLDGYHWKLVNGGKPAIHQTAPGELMRDPFLQRAPDRSFVMVWTWGWRDWIFDVEGSCHLDPAPAARGHGE